MPLLYLRDCSLGGVTPSELTPSSASFEARALCRSDTPSSICTHVRTSAFGVKLTMPDIPPDPQSTPAVSGVSCRGAAPPTPTGTPDIQELSTANATVSASAPLVVQTAAAGGNGVSAASTIDPSPAPSLLGRTTPAPAPVPGAASANANDGNHIGLLACFALQNGHHPHRVLVPID